MPFEAGPGHARVSADPLLQHKTSGISVLKVTLSVVLRTRRQAHRRCRLEVRPGATIRIDGGILNARAV